MTTPTLLEKELDELYKKVKKGESLGRMRKLFAYGLKIVAAGAGLAIATAKFAAFDQELGIAVLVAVLVDTVFSNHMRLIAEVEAAHAYAALGRRVKTTFNRNRGSASDDEIEEMMKTAHVKLSSGIDEIENRLAEVDIKPLKSLSLDAERNKGDG